MPVLLLSTDEPNTHGSFTVFGGGGGTVSGLETRAKIKVRTKCGLEMCSTEL